MDKRGREQILDICRQCGAKCCKGPSPNITIFDIVRILKYLGREPTVSTVLDYFEVYTHEEYIRKVLPERYGVTLRSDLMSFLNMRIGDLMNRLVIVKLRKRTDNSCIFLNEKYLTCTIYPVRPMACRAYPLKIQGCDNTCLLVHYGVSLDEERQYLRRYIYEVELHYRLLLEHDVSDVHKLVRLLINVWPIVNVS